MAAPAITGGREPNAWLLLGSTNDEAGRAPGYPRGVAVLGANGNCPEITWPFEETDGVNGGKGEYGAGTQELVFLGKLPGAGTKEGLCCRGVMLGVGTHEGVCWFFGALALVVEAIRELATGAFGGVKPFCAGFCLGGGGSASTALRSGAGLQSPNSSSFTIHCIVTFVGSAQPSPGAYIKPPPEPFVSEGPRIKTPGSETHQIEYSE